MMTVSSLTTIQQSQPLGDWNTVGDVNTGRARKETHRELMQSNVVTGCDRKKVCGDLAIPGGTSVAASGGGVHCWLVVGTRGETTTTERKRRG